MLRLLMQNIGDIIYYNKIVAKVFFTVTILISVSLLYLDSYNFYLYDEACKINPDTRTYCINASYSYKNLSERLSSLDDKFPLESTILFLKNTICIDNTELYAGIIYGDIEKKKIAMLAGNLNLDLSENLIILNDIFCSEHNLDKHLNNTISIGDEDYLLQAIGHIEYDNVDILFSQNYLKKKQPDISGLEITFTRRLEKNELAELNEILEEADIIIPSLFDASIIREYASRLLVIFICIFLSVMNIIGFYHYIIIKRKKEFLIYRICGMSFSRISLLIIMEISVLVFISCLIGSILYLLLYNIIREEINLQLELIHFIKTYAIFEIFACISALPILKNICRPDIYTEYIKRDR